MSEYVKWGWGCGACGFTGEEYNSGWTGRLCPHCLRDDDELAPPCFECGKIIEGWAHQNAGHWYCAECGPVANGDEELDSPF